MAYAYTAYSPDGQRVTGELDAPNERVAEEILWRQNYTIVSLREIAEGGNRSLFSMRLPTRDLIVFARQLATLIESGIPITRGLQLLQEQTRNKRFARVLSDITLDVQQGRFLSEAIMRRQNAFPPLFGRLIEVGERSGNLETVLRQVANYMEKEQELVRRVRGAMAYPAFVFLVAVGVVLLMLTFALPPLMSLFESFEAELPLPTRILLALTNFFAAYKLYIGLGALGAIIILILFLRTEAGRLVFDGLILRVPLIGRIVIEGAVARLCRTTSSLLRAGISLPEILEMVIRTQSNRVLRNNLADVHTELLQGQGFSGPLARRKIFPRMFVQMVRVGEETGSLDTNLETLAVFYENEVDRAVSALTGALEPAMTIFIGLVVGFIAVSVIMPMYSLMGAIK